MSWCSPNKMFRRASRAATSAGGGRRHAAVGQPRGGPQRAEESLRPGDGPVDAGRLVAAGQTPDALGILQKLGPLAAALVPHHQRHHQGQRLAVIHAVERGQLVPDGVRGPILRHAAADGPVQAVGGAPHEVRPRRVVPRIGLHLGGLFQDRQQDALGEAVLKRRIDVVSEILFEDLHEGVDGAVGELPRRERIGRLRIEDREPREGVLGDEVEFLPRGLPGDDRPAVHFRAGAGQGEDGAQRAWRRGAATNRGSSPRAPGRDRRRRRR